MLRHQFCFRLAASLLRREDTLSANTPRKRARVSRATLDPRASEDPNRFMGTLKAKKQLKRTQKNRRNPPGREKGNRRKELSGERRPQKSRGVEALAGDCDCVSHGDHRTERKGSAIRRKAADWIQVTPMA